MSEAEKKMAEWHELSDTAHAAAEVIGHAGPTVRVEDRCLKGFSYDAEGVGGKDYHSADTLRLYAKGLVEIADWLDRRAARVVGEQAHV